MDLKQSLSAAVSESAAPGAALAIIGSDGLRSFGAGVLNAGTGAGVGKDSPFLIGSITKVFTATLCMQLIERGALTLDTSVAEELPELRLSGDAGRLIAIRHLLSHSSGIDGDFFPDDSGGDEHCSLEKLLQQCPDVELLHPAGAMFSYCNLGYLLLGRILEKHSGDSWNEILDKHLLKPLQLNSASLDFDSNVVASGHTPGAGGTQLQIHGAGPWSNAAAGTRLSMSAADLARFAWWHLQTSKGLTSRSLLSESSALAMQQPLVATPFSTRYSGWGLGWASMSHAGNSVFGHDGGVAGTTAFLRVLPKQDKVIVLFANGPGYRDIYTSVVQQILVESGIEELPAADEKISGIPCAGERINAADYVATYRRRGLTVEIGLSGSQLTGTLGGEYGYPPSAPSPLTALSASTFTAYVPVVGDTIRLDFFDTDTSGCPGGLSFQDRVYRRQPRRRRQEAAGSGA